MDQVEQYDPPPNPAKLTDSRAGGYIDEYGDQSWELDALSPDVLANLIRAEVTAHRDETAWRRATDRMERERGHLSEVSDNWPDVTEWLQER
jgi:hypothetical protein